MSPVSRRAVLSALGALGLGAGAPAGLRLTPASAHKQSLWSREDGPHLRGAVFVQRRIYPSLDGVHFMGSGPVGTPITDAALNSLAEAGGNLASWSGPGPFSETAPYAVDRAIEDHITRWLDRCQGAGLFTVLCFRSGPGRSAFAFHPEESWYPPELYDVSLWHDEEKQAAWTEMVAWSLERFGSHPALAGIVAIEEPNARDLGYGDVSERMARQILARCGSSVFGTPLMLSPDRWARLSEADSLRAAVGADPVLVTHDYSPWAFTHPAEEDRRFQPRQAGPAPHRSLGPAAVLEFGAPRGVRDLARYLHNRIEAYEAAGTSWAVFRWTSGWQPYESREGSRSLSEDAEAMGVLTAAFARNLRRP